MKKPECKTGSEPDSDNKITRCPLCGEGRFSRMASNDQFDFIYVFSCSHAFAYIPEKKPPIPRCQHIDFGGKGRSDVQCPNAAIYDSKYCALHQKRETATIDLSRLKQLFPLASTEVERMLKIGNEKHPYDYPVALTMLYRNLV